METYLCDRFICLHLFMAALRGVFTVNKQEIRDCVSLSFTHQKTGNDLLLGLVLVLLVFSPELSDVSAAALTRRWEVSWSSGQFGTRRSNFTVEKNGDPDLELEWCPI